VIWGEALQETLHEIRFFEQKKQSEISNALEERKREDETGPDLAMRNPSKLAAFISS